MAGRGAYTIPAVLFRTFHRHSDVAPASVYIFIMRNMKIRTKLEVIFWKILRWSGIFNYWYSRHLTELCFELQRMGLDDTEDVKIRAKYVQKLSTLKPKKY